MERLEMAERMSKLIWTNCSSDDIFAIQLFVEELCIPEEVSGYSQEALRDYILSFMDKNNLKK